MADLQTLFSTVDQLSPQELIQLRNYVEQRTHRLLYTLSEEQLEALDEVFRPLREAAESMAEEEIDRAISEAVSEVRNERKTKNRR